ncbi:hypothetical protein AVEN_232425-1 [Araneus ventricosus]|uniref:Uncharacterized protein n=1 Tax=Araneus ventricosus TaxID=182803 RepID=A0A4Y2SN15_ARAVE|nr:hypothetical protein AVEN_232425-1 [Araneus ventricosus]
MSLSWHRLSKLLHHMRLRRGDKQQVSGPSALNTDLNTLKNQIKPQHKQKKESTLSLGLLVSPELTHLSEDAMSRTVTAAAGNNRNLRADPPIVFMRAVVQ